MTKNTRWGVAAIAAAHFLLAAIFSFGPIFEGPDESEHYRFVRYLIDHHALPHPAGQPYGQYHQAPLYYTLLAPIAATLQDEPAETLSVRPNPYHAYQIERPGNDNKNVYIHTRAEQFPYESATARAVHILRLTSPLLGVVTVLLSSRIFKLLWEDRPDRQLVALCLVAFWPQLLYVFSVLNNDVLLIPLATATLYLILHQQRHGPSWRTAILLGLVLGAALLTKLTGYLLVVPVGLATLVDRRVWKYAVVTFGVVLIVAGWWYMHNWMIVGDPLAFNAHSETWPREGIDQGTAWLATGLQRLPHAYTKVWARFGYGAVAVADWMYTLFDGAVLLALAGLAVRIVSYIFRSNRSPSQHAALASTAETRTQDVYRPSPLLIQSSIIVVWVLANILGLIYFAGRAFSGNQGRYLLPSIAAIAVLMTLGLEVWMSFIPRALRGVLVGACSIVLVIAILTGYFFPAYRALPVPEVIQKPLDVRYGETAQLIGMAPDNLAVRPGARVTIELYWRALAPSSPTLQTYLHAIDGEAFLWRDSLPGNGHRPADDWQPDELWAERYVINIPETLTAGEQYVLTVGLYDSATQQAIEAFAPDGASLSNTPGVHVLTVVED